MALTCTSGLFMCQESKMAQQDPGIQQAHMSALQGNLIYVTMSRTCVCVCGCACMCLPVTLVSKCFREEQMYARLPPNRRMCRKVGMVPEDGQMGLGCMLIKLSKANLVTNLQSFESLPPSSTASHHYRIIKKSVCIRLPLLVLTEKQSRTRQVAFLWLPMLLRASCIMWLHIRGSVQWQLWCHCHCHSHCKSPTKPSLDSLLDLKRANPPLRLVIRAPRYQQRKHETQVHPAEISMASLMMTCASHPKAKQWNPRLKMRLIRWRNRWNWRICLDLLQSASYFGSSDHHFDGFSWLRETGNNMHVFRSGAMSANRLYTSLNSKVTEREREIESTLVLCDSL